MNMKQILVLFAMLMLNLSNVSASESPYLITVNMDTKVMAVDFSKILGKTVNVTINDMKENEVFSELVTVRSKSRLYNLKNLNVGTYTVIVEDENQITYQKVYVSKNSLLADEKVEEINKPSIIQADNKWIVNGINPNFPAVANIYDLDGNKVFSESIANGTKSKAYNVAKLEKGVYTFIFSVNGKSFIQSVTKK